MMKPLSLFAAGLASALAAPACAQGTVDIGLYRNGDQLEVRLLPGEDHAGILSSIVFTVRWDRQTGAALGPIRQEGAPARFVPLMKSGGVREHGAFNYQVYAGFGMEQMAESGAGLKAGRELVIATIPVTGKGEFELVNDAYTGEAENNADYYISLGGRNATGIIYKGLATAEEDGSVSVIPNPNHGQFAFSFSTMAPTEVSIELVNALGQSVFSEQLRAFEGTYRKEMDLTGMSNGVYYLKIKRNGEATTHKVVYR